jgi:hypothetical protein
LRNRTRTAAAIAVFILATVTELCVISGFRRGVNEIFCSSGILCSVDLYLFTDFSEQWCVRI